MNVGSVWAGCSSHRKHVLYLVVAFGRAEGQRWYQNNYQLYVKKKEKKRKAE